MASNTLLKSLPNVGAAIARRSTTSNPILVVLSNPKFTHTGSVQEAIIVKDAINQAANETVAPGENMNHKAFSTPENISLKTGKDMTDMVSEAIDEVSERENESVEAAETTLEENTEESKDYVKANAKFVKKSMNTKNRI